jgi:glycerol-3-phosphate acyltransferase PlsY
MMPVFDTSPPVLVAVALAAYLVGSIPFGLVLARVMGLGDLRTIGSGNIGATNVLRTGNKLAALLTLLLDAGKGAAAVLAARAIAGEGAAQVAALAAFAGHLYPVFAGFRGGKGVATFLGVLLALAWPVGLAACAAWLAAALAFRFSSLAALVAAALSPVLAVLLGQRELVGLCILLAALVLWRHHENIARLRQGTEPRIGGGGARPD